MRQAYLGTQVAAGPSARRAPRSRAPGDELLGVGELTAGYGAAPVLQAISLQVRRGEDVARYEAMPGEAADHLFAARPRRSALGSFTARPADVLPVSYTHLTLPTLHSV